MRSRYLQSLVVLAVLLNGHSSASDASVEMVPVRDGVSFQDLSNLAHLLGVRFTVFDYETVEPHCLHFYVDETSVYGESTKHDGHGICGLDGPHRLTVQWQVEDSSLHFTFRRYRRDVAQGTSIGGPKLEISDTRGESLRGIDPPVLEIGLPVLVLHGSMSNKDRQRMEFKVLVELRSNPNGTIGTE